MTKTPFRTFSALWFISNSSETQNKKFRNAFSSKFLKFISSHNAEKVRNIMDIRHLRVNFWPLKVFVSILGNKDLILGLWWLISSLWESSFCSGSRVWIHGIIFRPLWVYFGRLVVYFGFQRSSFTICESNLGLLVYFRLLSVDYRPLSINFLAYGNRYWAISVDFLYRKSSNLGIILNLWESILESGNLF